MSDKYYKAPELEWESCQDKDMSGIVAPSIIGCFMVKRDIDSLVWNWSCLDPYEMQIAWFSCDSLEHGKQLCNDHYHAELVKKGFVVIDIDELIEQAYEPYGGWCKVEGCTNEASSGGTHWRESGYWTICSKHGDLARRGDPQPQMKKEAIEKEAKPRPYNGIFTSKGTKIMEINKFIQWLETEVLDMQDASELSHDFLELLQSKLDRLSGKRFVEVKEQEGGLWAARENDGRLFGHSEKPIRDPEYSNEWNSEVVFDIPSYLLPELQPGECGRLILVKEK